MMFTRVEPQSQAEAMAIRLLNLYWDGDEVPWLSLFAGDHDAGEYDDVLISVVEMFNEYHVKLPHTEVVKAYGVKLESSRSKPVLDKALTVNELL